MQDHTSNHSSMLKNTWKNNRHNDCHSCANNICVYCKKHGHLINECSKLNRKIKREKEYNKPFEQKKDDVTFYPKHQTYSLVHEDDSFIKESLYWDKLEHPEDYYDLGKYAK